ncbi:redoxin domain-containing protein [Candidatus Sumerlaeota bacterium]|nr:redoxin domain-containing protein [Candidatus Sumerlaeota bacterium]
MRVSTNQSLTLIGVITFLLAVFTGCGSLPKSTPDMPVIRVQIVDENGNPLKGVRATATRVEISEDGRVLQGLGEPRRLKASDKQGIMMVVGRGDVLGAGPLEWEISEKTKRGFGYRMTLWGKDILSTNVSSRFSSFPRTITVQTPVDMQLKLDGKTVSGKPTIAAADESELALTKKAEKSLRLKKTGKDTWTVRVKDGQKYVIGWLAGKRMWGYLSPEFAAERGKTVVFSPGLPATLQYSVVDVPSEVSVAPYSVGIAKAVEANNKEKTSPPPKGTQRSDTPTTVTIKNLAGGAYQLAALHQPVRGVAPEFPYLDDSRTIMLKPGIENIITAEYPKRVVEGGEGDVTIKGVLLRKGGDVVTSTTIQLRAFNALGEPEKSIYYPDVKTDPEGRFSFAGVSPKFNYIVSAPQVGEGSVQAKLSAATLRDDKNPEVMLVSGVPRMEFRPRAQAPEVSLTMQDGGTMRLSKYLGKTVLLMVWERSSQSSLASLKKMDEFAAIPRDRTDLVFLALNTDSSSDAWRDALEKYPTKGIQHAWLDLRTNENRISEDLPYFVLIDQFGVVRGTSPDFDINTELLRMGYRPKPPATPASAPKKAN